MGRQPRIELVDYRPSQVDYRWCKDAGAYRHNFVRDLQGIAIWQAARRNEEVVLKEISECFDVLQVYEITWSRDHVASNFNRIYGRDPSDPSSRHTKVGVGPFLYVIVEDRDPAYIAWQNISGKIELTNRSIAHLKPRIRSMAQTDEFAYNIHSSNSLTEFMRDAVLFLGVDRFSAELMAGFPMRHGHLALEQDMPGAGGWSSLDEMFQVMRYASNAVVLRGYEEIRNADEGAVDEIDILCDDLGFLSGASCATPNNQDPTKSAFTTVVRDQRVKLDARCVGDGYYDARWQQGMLDTALWDEDGFPVLEPANYLFSLLYHAKVQKPEVKPIYRRVLPELASTIGLPAEIAREVASDDVAARLLRGYLEANGYQVPRTRDVGVYRNQKFAAHLGSRVEDRRRNGAGLVIRKLRRRAARNRWMRRAYRSVRSTIRGDRRRAE